MFPKPLSLNIIFSFTWTDSTYFVLLICLWYRFYYCLFKPISIFCLYLLLSFLLILLTSKSKVPHESNQFPKSIQFRHNRNNSQFPKTTLITKKKKHKKQSTFYIHIAKRFNQITHPRILIFIIRFMNRFNLSNQHFNLHDNILCLLNLQKLFLFTTQLR